MITHLTKTYDEDVMKEEPCKLIIVQNYASNSLLTLCCKI